MSFTIIGKKISCLQNACLRLMKSRRLITVITPNLQADHHRMMIKNSTYHLWHIVRIRTYWLQHHQKEWCITSLSRTGLAMKTTGDNTKVHQPLRDIPKNHMNMKSWKTSTHNARLSLLWNQVHSICLSSGPWKYTRIIWLGSVYWICRKSIWVLYVLMDTVNSYNFNTIREKSHVLSN